MATVSKRQAESALRRVEKAYPGYPFRLFEPGFHADTWTIASEEAPFEWTISEKVWNLEMPAGVWVEPLNHWALCLWPQ